MIEEKQERILDLRSVFGVEARITASSSETDGEYVEMDCTATQGSGTMIHYHPQQEETFQVLEGTLDIFSNQQWKSIQAGESFTVPRGTVHAWRNASGAPIRFMNVHRPALGFQSQMETLDHLIKVGKVRGTKDPRSLIYMSMSAVKHRPDVTVKPPQWVINTLAFIGRRLGYTLD